MPSARHLNDPDLGKSGGATAADLKSTSGQASERNAPPPGPMSIGLHRQLSMTMGLALNLTTRMPLLHQHRLQAARIGDL